MPPVSVLRPNTSPLRNEKHNIGAGMCLRYRGLIQPILNLLVRRFAGHITALNLDHHASREPGREAHVTSVAVSGEGEAVGVREPTGPSRTSNGGFGCSADIAWTSRHKEVSFLVGRVLRHRINDVFYGHVFACVGYWVGPAFVFDQNNYVPGYWGGNNA